MTNITPDIKKPALPSLSDLLDRLKREVLRDINCVKIGTIQSFNAVTQEVEVEIAFTQVTSTSVTGVQTYATYPLLLNVPVLFPCGGGFTLTFPITVGDECVVLFNDRQIDAWLASGAGLPPPTSRAHDLSDGIAIVGVRNLTRSLASVSTNSAQLRSDDGTTFVDVNALGVKVHAGTVYEWDVHGYGQKITWTGGANYTIDNYTVGAVITTNNHSIAPPGPP